MDYIRNGDLNLLAKKTVTLQPRFMFPISLISLFQYFIMACGGINWLEYLPSVTWSTWPYVNPFASFGIYISEMIELMYLQPPGVPKIVFNYCTGILWTVCVQLQGAWMVLSNVIVIREMSNPWKRYSYCLVMIILNWYARSWGSFFWTGIVFTDLDLRLKYRDWLYARPWAYRALITVFIMLFVVASSPDVVSNFSFDFPTAENNIHPDIPTGKMVGQTGAAGFPQYYIPRLDGLVAITALQGIVEINRTVQSFLKLSILQAFFPHMFTIYLMHGLVWWTFGAYVCIELSVIGLPYWANLLVVAVVCYGTLFLSLPFFTKLIDKVGRDWSKWIWKDASETPVPRRNTTFPFDPDVFLKYTQEKPELPLTEKPKDKSGVVVKNPFCDNESNMYKEKMSTPLDSKPSTSVGATTSRSTSHFSELNDRSDEITMV
jgi:hypothetical protein